MNEWNVNNPDFNSSYSGNDYDKIPVFYTENYSKPKKKKKNKQIMQLILVAVLSSILGGTVVFGAFQFLAPTLQPTVGGYLEKTIGQSLSDNRQAQANDYGVIKRYEIEQVDSPVVAIAEEVSPSIVGVRTTTRVQNFLYGTVDIPGEGSGIIMRSDGYIMTNNHVIEAAMADNMTNKMISG
jgi:serine protease Do